MLLSVLDRKWREHLYEMDYLKAGIGLRAMAQRDPLVEYQREGYDMFQGMLEGLKEESVGFLFNLQVEATPTPAPAGPARGAGLTVSPGLASPVGAGGTKSSAPPKAPAAASLGASKPAPAPSEEEPAKTAAAPVPTALRAKGLDERPEERLTFSGPAEDGGTAVRRTGGAAGAATGGNAAAQGTRRERREAARAQAKSPKSSRGKKKR